MQKRRKEFPWYIAMWHFLSFHNKEGRETPSIERQPTFGWLSFVKAVSLSKRVLNYRKKKILCQLLEYDVDMTLLFKYKMRIIKKERSLL